MTEPTGAVFLSYASQDAEAARRICEALRAAGIEVWFDQSELRGGDAWDRQIRKQIHDCALFMPIISANTQARPEGYFRLEWRLADQRTHLMGRSRAFLLPVCIDDTPDADADAPDSFLAVQWTRVPVGETPPAFVARIQRLLSPEAHAVHAGHAPPAAAPPMAAAPTTRAAAAQGRKLPVGLLIAAVAVIAAGYLALDKFVLSKRPAAAAAALAAKGAAAAPVAATIPEKSVAVLPFADMSEKKDQEYFSDGLTEELIDLLAQVQDLRVPARTSSFFFKGKQVTIAEIARALGVAHVLEGSVRKAGNTLRVTVQLIRADNGYHLWSKTYDGDTKDIFKVQDEIAAAVVEALKGKLLATQQLASRHRTTNTEAYAQYLRGNQLRVSDSEESNARALAAYKKAIALDPNYAAAYGGLAETEWRIADQSTGEQAGFERAAAAAERAIALAPDSSEGYWARGVLRESYSFDWRGAQADFEKALALDPNDVRALIDAASLMATLGRIQDGIMTLHKVVTYDPLSVVAWRDLGTLLAHAGQFSAAREAISRALEINPVGITNNRAGAIELLAGRPREALALYQNGIRDSTLIGTAMAEHSLGHAAESQRALDALIKNKSLVWAYQIACVYAWRGQNDQAFAWLERAYHQHDGGLSHLPYDRIFASIRDDPRYKALLRKMNLPE